MLGLLVVPDAELYLTGYLRAQLPVRGYPATVVSISAPDPLPAQLVVVRRDGGSRLDAVREVARIGVQIWAGDDSEVSALARLVAALVVACPDGAPVVRAEQQSGPSSVTEPNPDRRKRYCTFELTVRCSPPA